ncbi:hypothetical protein [Chitinophaga nivalis]|uniref:Uncharacterized protein n=1 Tax=Chitinophaga nivalis TaxID=2991709 RepID=A0ABT3IU02_9BACT|nr:hypothetical protein [Chitinophaga nivalis]MCW3462910.1 hypothetical protein [Chitinophaga nivalis]MCW3487400.1 hypothetical protein [Chitinophaga nivalis]
MNKREDIANELRRIIPDVHWPAYTPYTAPVGYFEHFPETVITQIRSQESPASALPPVTPQLFTTPAGYFDALPATVLQRVRTLEATPAAELTELSPFLATLSRQTPFSIPEGYFETLPVPLHAASPTLRVHHRKRNGWIKWAAAACLSIFAGTSTLLFLEHEHTNSIEKQLETVSDQEIVNYLQTHTDAFDNEAIFTTIANTGIAPLLSHPLHEDVPLEAIETYLQQSDLPKEVLPHQ